MESRSAQSAPQRPATAAPTAVECNRLAALFNAGRFAELEDHARQLIGRHPESGFVWKMLGVTLQVQGKDALAAMQKATLLMPNDAGAHSNLGNTLLSLGRLDEAAASFRRALTIQPYLVEAHYNLGLALKALGKLDDAAACYRRALAVKPGYVEAHNNLGNALRQLGRTNDAAASYRQALALKPDYMEAHNNLIYALRELGLSDEAAACCRRALALNPDHAETHDNLAHVLSDMGERDQAIISYRNVLALDPTWLGSGAACWLTVLYFLKEDWVQCRDMLITSQEVKGIGTEEYMHGRIYRNCVARLLRYFEQYGALNAQAGERDHLYVIGESTSLTAHCATVDYRGRKMRGKAEWIVGCKQWHLGNDVANQHKSRFESIAAALPSRSTILLSIGGLDCFPGKGILEICQKNPAASLQDVALATIGGYVAYVSRIVAPYGHRAIVGGVQAPCIGLVQSLPDTAQQLVAFVRLFNAILKEKARAAGMDFLDIYAMTDRGDGIASDDWYIDLYHLLPRAFPEAFDKHCLGCD
ncbi:MAG: tetratricopeptide repeat protein [Burkholderiaceae bacterium]|nr:tetratricopeptide repeat protein [Burkholderiaceae bacterium]